MSKSSPSTPGSLEPSTDAAAEGHLEQAPAETSVTGPAQSDSPAGGNLLQRGLLLAIGVFAGTILGGYCFARSRPKPAIDGAVAAAVGSRSATPSAEASVGGGSPPTLCNQAPAIAGREPRLEPAWNAPNSDPKLSAPAAQAAASRGRRRMRHEAMQFTSPESGAKLNAD